MNPWRRPYGGAREFRMGAVTARVADDASINWVDADPAIIGLATGTGGRCCWVRCGAGMALTTHPNSGGKEHKN